MAELHLSVVYKKKQMKPLLWIAYAVFPIWSVIAPATLAILIVFIIQYQPAIPPWLTLSLLLTLFFTFLFGLLYSAFAEDKSIHITKEGMSFPLFLLRHLKFKRHRNWDELSEAELIETSQDTYLKLTFKPDSSVVLSLSSFDKQQLEEMLLAIELWGKKCTRSDRLIQYQRELQSTNTDTLKIGYTQMWEEELARRFHATTFIPLEPGTKLKDGSLVVEKQLAFGGLSAIYLVQKDGQDLFILKEAVVPEDVDEENRKTAEEYILRESKMLFSLSHPSIASVVDYFVENDRNYLLLDYIHGQDLRQLVVQNGIQTERIVVKWIRQIAEALLYLHSQSPPVIHRDMTPDNILLRENGDIVIIDFGAANEFVGTATGTLIGKQAYIAPEQLRGKASPVSDLYALGGTMYYLLTGRDPVPLSQPELKSILPEAHQSICDLIKQLTEFEKEDRIQSAEALLAALDEIDSELKSGTTP